MRSWRVLALLGLLAVSGCAVAVPPEPASPQPAGARPTLDATALAADTHARSNVARREAGLAPLQWDEALVPLARRHSTDMARRDFFGHSNPDGHDVNARAAALGLTCEYREGNLIYRGFGENLFQTYRYSGYETTMTPSGGHVRYDWYTAEQIAEQAVTEWLESPGHRRNLLSAQYRRHAVAVAFGDGDKIYFTDVFC